jgi:hypothetical protein
MSVRSSQSESELLPEVLEPAIPDRTGEIKFESASPLPRRPDPFESPAASAIKTFSRER